jgi:guanyl-specific ribonuclease Sa
MEMISVLHHNVSAVGYDQETSTLRVEFSNGSAYEYDGVSQGTYDGLLSAENVGKYFSTNVRSLFVGRRVV